MDIKDLARRAKSVNIQELKRQAVSNKAPLLVDLQRKQIRQGLDADGDSLGTYPPGYGAFKETLSTYQAPPGVPDLYLSGMFHRGIRMKLSGDEYEFDSSDSKNAKLTDKYDPLWGLNKTTFPQAQINCTLEFNKLAKEALGL